MGMLRRVIPLPGLGVNRFRLAIIGSVILGLVAAGCSKGSSSTQAQGCGQLSLGVIGPLTGDQAVFGQVGPQIGNWVIGDFNKAHPDCQLKLVQFDTQANPAQATALARKAVSDSSIIGVVGPLFSFEVEPAGPILQEAGLPFITPEATAADLSQKGWKFFHRTVGSDAQEGPADADYIVNTFHASKVAVIDDGEPYGVGLASIVRDTLTGLSASIVDKESIQLGGTDFSSTVGRVEAANPQAVFCGCLYTEAGRLLKQLRDSGYKGDFMGGAGTYTPSLITQAGSQEAEGAVAASAGQDPSLSDAGQSWLDQWNKFSNNKPLGLYAPEFYNAFIAFTTAIDAGKTTREAINNFLLQSRTYDGATGPFHFDSHGDVRTATVNFYVVKGGKFVYQQSKVVQGASA
jgi:branched-chain amino acid transport system substrate-binding protein